MFSKKPRCESADLKRPLTGETALNRYGGIFAAVNVGYIPVGLQVIFPGYAVEEVAKLIVAVRPQIDL